MCLRVPCIQIQNVRAAVRFWLVRWRVSLREGTKCPNPLAFEVQPKRIIDRVARFVTQDAHALNVAAAFDFAHLLALEFHQSRMRQIKRNCEAGHAIRREPFCRQPDVRLETNAALVQLTVKSSDVRFNEGAFDTYRQIADTSVKQALVRDETPFESHRHRGEL